MTERVEGRFGKCWKSKQQFHELLVVDMGAEGWGDATDDSRVLVWVMVDRGAK